MKKFNKLRFLQWLGLFRYRFDFEKLEFQEAWQYRVRAALLTSLFSTFGLKIYLTKFWPYDDPKQLLIGSVFNYLDPLPKQFMIKSSGCRPSMLGNPINSFSFNKSYIGLGIFSWSLSSHIAFNYFNGKKDFLFWMKTTYEIKAKTDKDYEVAGLTKEENKRFWWQADLLCYYWFKLVNYSLVFIAFIFNIGLFLVKFPDWDWYSYVLLQTIHIVQNSYYVIGFQHLIDTCSLFVVISIAYYTKKFAFIGRQLRRLNVSGRKRTDNRRLANLINDFTRVHVELLKMRKFFSGLIGCHVVGYFGLAALTTFFAIFVDLRLRIVVLVCLAGIYAAVICLPFYFGSCLRTEIGKTTRALEFAASRRSISTRNKEKINSISGVKDKLGFTCFDWFELNLQNGLKVRMILQAWLQLSIEISVSFLLLFEAYLMYLNF